MKGSVKCVCASIALMLLFLHLETGQADGACSGDLTSGSYSGWRWNGRRCKRYTNGPLPIGRQNRFSTRNECWKKCDERTCKKTPRPAAPGTPTCFRFFWNGEVCQATNEAKCVTGPNLFKDLSSCHALCFNSPEK